MCFVDVGKAKIFCAIYFEITQKETLVDGGKGVVDA